tara:strand:+ start:251 stop:847 length:597 start_codon:yes stop_codon:yes gene_type:complete
MLTFTPNTGDAFFDYYINHVSPTTYAFNLGQKMTDANQFVPFIEELQKHFYSKLDELAREQPKGTLVSYVQGHIQGFHPFFGKNILERLIGGFLHHKKCNVNFNTHVGGHTCSADFYIGEDYVVDTTISIRERLIDKLKYQAIYPTRNLVVIAKESTSSKRIKQTFAEAGVPIFIPDHLCQKDECFKPLSTLVEHFNP